MLEPLIRPKPPRAEDAVAGRSFPASAGAACGGHKLCLYGEAEPKAAGEPGDWPASDSASPDLCPRVEAILGSGCVQGRQPRLKHFQLLRCVKAGASHTSCYPGAPCRLPVGLLSNKLEGAMTFSFSSLELH